MATVEVENVQIVVEVTIPAPIVIESQEPAIVEIVEEE